MEKSDLPQRTEAGVIVDLVKKHVAATVLDTKSPHGENAPVLILPEGLKAQSIKPLIDEWRTCPERRKGTATLGDLDSFIAHANRFKDAGSALFANQDPRHPSLTAVLDYHPRGDASPRFGQHRGLYPFPLSEEWTAWTANASKPMDQATFAEFIESRITDVAAPTEAGGSAKKLSDAIACSFASPSKLLELSRGLTVRVGARIANHQNLSTGEAQLTYQSEHQDEKGQPLKVPGAFLLALSVFRSGELYQVAARLRYRVREAAITWSYELYRIDRIFDDAFKEACDRARDETELPLFVGSPE